VAVGGTLLAGASFALMISSTAGWGAGSFFFVIGALRTGFVSRELRKARRRRATRELPSAEPEMVDPKLLN
jgi:hypothetical protein